MKSDDKLDETAKYNETSRDVNSLNCTTDELTGLIPGTKYGCQLYAINGVGRGSSSARRDYTTVPTGEQDMVTVVVVIAVYSGYA